MALFVSERPCAAAGVYTTNTVKAAPVEWDEFITSGEWPVYGIVVNSGNANACTGVLGRQNTRDMAAALALKIGKKPENVLVCSTGVIGVPLPMDIVTVGIEKTARLLGNKAENFSDASESILTTDTFTKVSSRKVSVGGREVTIYGCAKGSGMTHPNMATMLAFVLTDAPVEKNSLQAALSQAVAATFNMISVDGDTSTNDTALVLANGAAGGAEITQETEEYHVFEEALTACLKELAIDIARDGEGATKLLEVRVSGAKTLGDARTLARSVVSSNLFKAAMFGADANWGRALCAMGYSGAFFNQERVAMDFRSAKGVLPVMKNGAPQRFDEARAKEILLEADIFIDIFLGDGDAGAVAWGCDLTYDYVKINGDYRT
jgi:glutamate N-acetyltransferase/amino-acid N-acetyltransferase